MKRWKLTARFRRGKAKQPEEDYDRAADERLTAELTGSFAKGPDFMGLGRHDTDKPRY